MTKDFSRTLLKIGLVAVLVLLCAGQETVAQQSASKVYDEQLRVALDKQTPTRSDVTLDVGGWLSFAFFDYDDAAARKERTLREFQLRGWLSLNLQDTHQFYVRGLLNFDDWNSNTNSTGGGDDFDERIERAWYQVNLGRLLGCDPGSGFNMHFKVGRDFQTIGNSLVLSIPLDMINVQADIGDWQVTSFVGRTIWRSNNIDDSLLLDNRQDRVIFGTEVAYEGFSNHRPFVYFLGNWDHTDPAAASPSQSYRYDSRYVGIGSRGILCSDNLRYEVEFAGEWGETYSNNVTSGRDHIEAYAFDLMLEYLFDCQTRPRVMLEYIFGSGDPDRTTSAVATAGGNTVNTPDNAFNAFGFRDTGIAFAPEISNIHVFTGGVSCFPLENSEMFKNLETGAKIFFYAKDRPGGAISDTTGTNNARWVGFEWDLFCNWRITSDLAWTVRYGMFHPSSAYDGGDKSPRDFLYTGIVLSF